MMWCRSLSASVSAGSRFPFDWILPRVRAAWNHLHQAQISCDPEVVLEYLGFYFIFMFTSSGFTRLVLGHLWELLSYLHISLSREKCQV
ncbi:unnamed protein product [Urochloa humidicola]